MQISDYYNTFWSNGSELPQCPRNFESWQNFAWKSNVLFITFLFLSFFLSLSLSLSLSLFLSFFLYEAKFT